MPSKINCQRLTHFTSCITISAVKNSMIRHLKSTHIFSRLCILSVWVILAIIATLIYYKKELISYDKPYPAPGEDWNHPPNGYLQALEHDQNIARYKQSDLQQIDRIDFMELQTEKPLTPNTNKKFKSDNYYKCVYDKSPGSKEKIRQLGRKERIVHLDLKGAPPKLSYYRKLFPLLRKMGATGLLIEYEDMFPYSGELREIASPNAYTLDEVNQLLQLAMDNQLRTIPLIQTFGHMEFVLKHAKFANLREFKDDPRILSPVFNESWTLITAMIDQVALLHDRSWYFHIGCDEVDKLGQGVSKEIMDTRGWQPDDLFTWHVKRVVDYVTQLMYKPMMWDDMLRREEMTVDKIQKSGLHETVNIVMWVYNALHAISKRHTHLQKYEKLFKTFWVASAFKGGDAWNDSVVSVGGRVDNQFEWLQLVRDYKINNGTMELKGTVVTGWQRFNHRDVLCELLPAGIPSLAYCLSVLTQGCFDEKSHRSISTDVLKCDSPVNLNLTEEISDPSLCQFPGHEIYEIIQAVYCMTTNQTTKSQSVFATMGREELKVAVRKYFGEMYHGDTVDEWLALVFDGRKHEIIGT